MPFARTLRAATRITTGSIALILAVTCGVVGLAASPAAAAPSTPVNLRAFTGGPSVALLWNPGSGTTATQYRVYRNSTQVATVTPQTGYPTNTVRYIDAGAPIGVSVSYQVAGVDSGGAVGPKSTPVNVTRPAADNTTPTPTVNLDASIPSDLLATFQTNRALILDWYPKFADKLAYPNYTAPAALTLAAANTGYPGITSGTTITLDIGWLRDSTHAGEFPGVFLHEMTHVIQMGYSCPNCGWVAEGLAVWATHNIYNDVDPVRTASAYQYFTRGYSETEPLLIWATEHYGKPNFVRELNIAAHGGTPVDAFSVQQTGKTPRQLWDEMQRANTSISYTPPTWQTLKLTTSGTPGTCIEVAYGDSGRAPAAANCWNTYFQVFLGWSFPNGGSEYESAGAGYRCLDLSGGVTTPGTAIVWGNCGLPPAVSTQRWTVPGDGLFHNAAGSNACLQASPDPNDGSHQKLTLQTCSTGVAGQRLTLVPA